MKVDLADAEEEPQEVKHTLRQFNHKPGYCVVRIETPMSGRAFYDFIQQNVDDIFDLVTSNSMSSYHEIFKSKVNKLVFDVDGNTTQCTQQ